SPHHTATIQGIVVGSREVVRSRYDKRKKKSTRASASTIKKAQESIAVTAIEKTIKEITSSIKKIEVEIQECTGKIQSISEQIDTKKRSKSDTSSAIAERQTLKKERQQKNHKLLSERKKLQDLRHQKYIAIN
ncbi:hypothetical protein EC973_000519, partial [Apophysomyces ossiformis]